MTLLLVRRECTAVIWTEDMRSLNYKKEFMDSLLIFLFLVIPFSPLETSYLSGTHIKPKRKV